MEPCLEVKILSYHLLHYTVEKITQNFSKPTKAFNLAIGSIKIMAIP